MSNIIVNNTVPETSCLIGIKSVTLTDTQTKTLPTSYIEIVPAPGENKILGFLFSVIIQDSQGGAYTNIDADNIIRVVYGEWDCDASEIMRLSTANVKSFLIGSSASSADQRVSWANMLSSDVFANTSQIVNQPLKLIMYNDPSGNLTGGNIANTLKVTIYYVVIDI